MADIKEKIKKLLSLASSPNENEARAALLKAQELMAKHKLTEMDVQGLKIQELKNVLCADIRWTTDSGDILWMPELVELLCKNYMCTSSWYTPKGRRTHYLTITGLEQDVGSCRIAVSYAVGFVRGRIGLLRRRYKSEDARSVSVSYATGFTTGLRWLFEEQKKQHTEWALVPSTPQKVQEYRDSLSDKTYKTKSIALDSTAYAVGTRDGRNFNKVKPLEGGTV